MDNEKCERQPMRIAFALPGLHAEARGAEVAFESIAAELARREDCDVTLIGAGAPRPDQPYHFVQGRRIGRKRFEHWPSAPLLRTPYMYEELTFLPGLIRGYDPANYDITVTCAYPYTNWWLRARGGTTRPKHVFVTQNGDWPLREPDRECRWFSCDGLVCTNPEYFARHQDRWPAALIPNGVDPDHFAPGVGDRRAFGLPEDVPVALMVSALTRSKRVLEGIRAAAAIPELNLVVAGDGPLRDAVRTLGAQLMPGRFQQLSVAREWMPRLYQSVDVMLHMSVDEPSANAYIEALATGLPVVTHDREVTRWTFEDAAWLVDTTCQEAVQNALRGALAENRERQVASRRELVQRRFTWRAIAAEHARFYDAIQRNEADAASVTKGSV